MSRENGIDEIEVHVATLCFDEQDGALRVLIGKRADNRKLYPGLWECGGGQVRRGQTFQEAVRAQMKDEFGLDVEVLFPSGDYKIETEGKIIPGVRFVCKPKPGQKVKIGSEHTEFCWVAPGELSSFDLIPGLADDIRQAIALRSRLTK